MTKLLTTSCKITCLYVIGYLITTDATNKLLGCCHKELESAALLLSFVPPGEESNHPAHLPTVWSSKRSR